MGKFYLWEYLYKIIILVGEVIFLDIILENINIIIKEIDINIC